MTLKSIHYISNHNLETFTHTPTAVDIHIIKERGASAHQWNTKLNDPSSDILKPSKSYHSHFPSDAC